MRFSFLCLCLLGLVASACTPFEPNKAANAGSCKTNADCKSGVCKDNKCVNRVDCNDIANIAEPFCQNILCNETKDCPTNFSCSKGTCVGAPDGACFEDEQCTGSDAGPYCLQQSPTDMSQNHCVECRTSENCPANKKICNKAYKCESPATGCKSDANCAGTATPRCVAGKCAECRGDADCKKDGKKCDTTTNVCKAPDPNSHCTEAGGCPQENPICLTSTMPPTCVSCESAPDQCPANTTCDSGADSPTRGQCVGDNTGTSLCSDNLECQNTGTGAGILDGTVNDGLTLSAQQIAANATFWCDFSNAAGDGKKQCKPCRTGAGNTDCNPGYTCRVIEGDAVCALDPNSCSSAADCPDGQACNSGVGGGAGTCSGNCAPTGANNCKDPYVCSPDGGCEEGVDCSTGNASACDASGRPGYACVNKVCRPCEIDAQCASSSEGKTRCDPTTRRCVAPPSTLKKLGDFCTSIFDCESGSCLDFGNGLVCSQPCTRTQSTAENPVFDCPRTVDPSVVTSRGAANAKPSQGFACLNGTFGSNLDGIGACVLPVDYDIFFARNSLSVANAFTVAAGQAPSASNGLTCQATYASNAFGAGTQCDYVCGRTEDCVAQGLTGYSCTEILTTPPNGQAHGNGRHVCRPTPPAAKVPGDFCRRPSDCSEGFCDGRVIARALPVSPAKSCTTSTNCSSGQECIDGKCYAPTKRSSPASCTSDAVCRASTQPGRSLDECWDGECYPPQARQNISCQDSNGVPSPVSQFCAGRCAKHCNSEADCSGDLLQPNMLCGYRPSSPGTGNTLTGNGWSRVCVNPAPVLAGTDPENDHTRLFGETCANENTECKSEICARGKESQPFACTSFCGREGDCPAGYHCSIVEVSVDPYNVDPNAKKLLKPLCIR